MKKVYSECPSFDEIVPALLDVGVKRLPEVCHFKLGVPVKPMLAKPTKGVTEVLDKFQDRLFTCEYKYDGERAQVMRTSLKTPFSRVITSDMIDDMF
jgi:DNA ligase-1